MMAVGTADPIVSQEEVREPIPPVSDLRAQDTLSLMKEYDQKLRSLLGRLRQLDGSGKLESSGKGKVNQVPWLSPKEIQSASSKTEPADVSPHAGIGPHDVAFTRP